MILRHLGSVGYLLFWFLAASGIYLYARFDTSAAGAYASIGELEWWFGGVLRSVHRYAADLFVVVSLVHLGKEIWDGHFRGFRAFSWISGIPLLWLVYAAGLIGYWLVWDVRSQFSFQATLEWLGLAARAGEAPDRLFSLFVFLHIGLPLALLAGMWIHVQRLGRPETAPPRALAWLLGALLLLLSIFLPASSEPQWDPSRAPQAVAVDWFYQFIHPLMYATSPSVLWILVIGSTLALLVTPFVSRRQKLAAAVVDPKNCNGCQRCVADCPYNAIEMKAGKASVLAARCAACGICAGACPSSTPFRSIRELVSGIELPDASVQDLRRKVRNALDAGTREIVFHCENQPRREGIALRCLAMLPPAFVDWALRNGAARVRAVGCEDCAYRLGMALSDERFARTREPRLRPTARVERKDHEYTFTHR
jgi:Pyruvate/2-oxoacid:ferredoxin oxidoreductase delta subunit